MMSPVKVILQPMIAFKILTIGYYWSSLHKDAARYTKNCDKFKCMGGPTKSDEMPL